MLKYYRYNPKIKKDMLSKYIKSNSEFQKKRNIAYVFYAIGIIILVACILLFYLQENKDYDFLFISIMSGLAFGMFPALWGFNVYVLAKKEYGKPYCEMTSEFLRTDDKGVQFGCHDTLDENTESMDVYSISYEDINRVTYNEDFNIVTITGCGQLTAYDDYAAREINIENSGRRFYNDSNYSFILCFEEQEEFLDLILSQQNWYDKDGNFKLF